MSRHVQRNLVAAFVLAAIVSSGCGSSTPKGDSGQASQAGESTQAALPRAMGPEEAKAFLAEHPEALLLDVRNPPEWESELKAIESAMLLPLPELSDRLAELEAWKGRPIVTVCRSGARSERARQILAEAGFVMVINLDGGMLAWKRAGY
jgi:rhodanese-related sulfurtransferase